MPKQMLELSQTDIAIAIEDYARNKLQLLPTGGNGVLFTVNQGDSDHYADKGPHITARLQVVPLESRNNDASNLPPMSNKVEGGGHFGLG